MLACLLLPAMGTAKVSADGTPRFEQVAGFARSPMTPARAGMLSQSNLLYLTASEGSNFNCGAILGTSSGTLGSLVHFTGRDGAAKGDAPSGALAGNGSLIWGVTTRGGVNDAGTVYRFTPGSNAVTTLVEFGSYVSGGEYTLGRNPTSGLARDGNGMLWGIGGGSPAVRHRIPTRSSTPTGRRRPSLSRTMMRCLHLVTVRVAWCRLAAS